jgi:hypothetical protein
MQAGCLVFADPHAHADSMNFSPIQPEPFPGWQCVAKLRSRSALEIGHSPWSIGIETIDRGYVDFAPIAPHLGALGATEARLQAGWARCDPGHGQDYEWAWLDEVVDGCLAQGVRPWLQTSYGNPAYEGGGGIGLLQGVPSSPEALNAWDRWVDALVDRYADRVSIWEIWNEADHRGAVTVTQYLDLFLRTAKRIRARQPGAEILALSLAGNLEFAEEFIRRIHEAGEEALVSAITFHGYPVNPDEGFEMPAKLAALRDRYLPGVELRQGETGAPARRMEGIQLALNKEDWSERKQAVWNLRRMLNHHRRAYRMSLFQLADMHYRKERGALFAGVNPKGLIATHTDQSVEKLRPSYFAAQHVFSLLDSTYPLRPLDCLPAPEGMTACAWQRADCEQPNLFVWWKSDQAPALEAPSPHFLKLGFPSLRDPLLLDFLSGLVFKPEGAFPSGLPCLDSPLALIERDTLDAVSLPS